MLAALADVGPPHGVSGYAVGTALAGLAAVLFAVGAVAQHEVAAVTSAEGAVRWRSVLAHPVWVASQAATVIAALVQVAALALAPVSIVQPLLAGGLVVALALRSFRDRRWPRAAQLSGAAMAAGGLAVFLVAAGPGQGTAAQPPTAATAALAALVILLMLAAVELVRGRVGAVACGLAAGVGLGVAAVLISAALGVLQHQGLVAALRSAPLWAALATAVAAMYCSQAAYSRGALALSLPVLSVVDPLAAVVAARVLLHEHLAAGHALVWAPAAVVAAAGVTLLALTADQPVPAEPLVPAVAPDGPARLPDERGTGG